MGDALWTPVNHVPLHYTLSNWLNMWLQKLTLPALREVIKAFFSSFFGAGRTTKINATFSITQSQVKTKYQQPENTSSLPDCSVIIWYANAHINICLHCRAVASKSLFYLIQAVNIHKPTWSQITVHLKSHQPQGSVSSTAAQVADCHSLYKCILQTLSRRRRRILKANTLPVQYRLSKQNYTWS